MDHKELRACLETMRWRQRDLADALQIDEAKARRMARGETRIPPKVAEWLAALAADVAAAHARHRPPGVS